MSVQDENEVKDRIFEGLLYDKAYEGGEGLTEHAMMLKTSTTVWDQPFDVESSILELLEPFLNKNVRITVEVVE